MKSKTRAGFANRISKRNKRRRNLKLGLWLSLPVGLLLGAVFLLRAEFLQIKAIEVSGTQSLADTEVERLASEFLAGAYWGLIPKTNVLLVDTRGISELLESRFDRLAKAEVDRGADLNLKIKIQEKQKSSVWCQTQNECFLVDWEGVVYARATQTESQEAPIFSGGIVGEPLGQKFLAPEVIEQYFELVARLKSLGVETSSIFLESKEKAVLQTSLGQIWVLPTDFVGAAVAENLLLLIETERAKDPTKTFEYIDLRFEGKVFFKTS